MRSFPERAGRRRRGSRQVRVFGYLQQVVATLPVIGHERAGGLRKAEAGSTPHARQRRPGPTAAPCVSACLVNRPVQHRNIDSTEVNETFMVAPVQDLEPAWRPRWPPCGPFYPDATELKCTVRDIHRLRPVSCSTRLESRYRPLITTGRVGHQSQGIGHVGL